MVDWQNPVTILTELGTSIKLLHVIDGIYLWEFICNLGFELSLLQSRRQWRWTAALYIACRFFTISQVATDIVGLNVTNVINCKVWVTFSLLFRSVASSFALSLYGIRTIAIWQRSMFAIIVTSATVTVNIVVWVYRVSELTAVWMPQFQACMGLHTRICLLNNGLLLASEVFFLLLMASGIYMRNSGLRAFKIMFREGLLWLTFAALIQTVPVVFLILNLNDPMNGLFIIPAVIFTSIGATRMYRTLSDRQAGNLLDFWETSRNETTGEIRFRRQTQLLARTDGPVGDTASTTALPMGRLVRPQPQPEERYVERFEARDIMLDDESSMRDMKRSMATEDDKSGAEWAHAK